MSATDRVLRSESELHSSAGHFSFRSTNRSRIVLPPVELDGFARRLGRTSSHCLLAVAGLMTSGMLGSLDARELEAIALSRFGRKYGPQRAGRVRPMARYRRK